MLPGRGKRREGRHKRRRVRQFRRVEEGRSVRPLLRRSLGSSPPPGRPRKCLSRTLGGCLVNGDCYGLTPEREGGPTCCSDLTALCARRAKFFRNCGEFRKNTSKAAARFFWRPKENLFDLTSSKSSDANPSRFIYSRFLIYSVFSEQLKPKSQARAHLQARFNKFYATLISMLI